MIASLPMYWRAETAEAWRAVWRDVQAAGQRRGLDLPDLTRPEDLPDDWTTHWRDPALALSHTCSMPFRTDLRDEVTYVGTFDFGLTCPPGYYYSQLITAPPESAPPECGITQLALNGYDSQSGFAAGTADFAGPGTQALCERTEDHLITGAHAASLQAVASGKAQAAYLDAVTFRLLQRFDPVAQQVHLSGTTLPTPGLPLITAKNRDPAPLRAAFQEAFLDAPWRGAAELGGLQGFVMLDPQAYLSLPIPTAPTKR